MRTITSLMVLLALGLTACGDKEGTTTTAKDDGPKAAATASDEDIGEVLADVNGMKVGSTAFTQAAAREVPADGEELTQDERLEILDRLVAEKLLYEKALDMGLDKDPKVQKVMVNTLLREEVYSKVRNSDFTDEELQAYYEEHKDEFVVPEKVQFKRILVRVSDERSDAEAKQLASEVRGKLAKDAKNDFKDLATEYSEDPYRRRGGDVGFVSRDGKPGLDQALVDKAFTMEVGELSEVFRTEDGYNLIYVANRRERVERSFQQMKGSVLRKLKNEKLKSMYEEYVAQLRSGAQVEVYADKVGAVEVKSARRRPGMPGLDVPSLANGPLGKGAPDEAEDEDGD